MDSVKKRKLFLAFFLPFTGMLAVYGLLSPVSGSILGSALLLLLVTALYFGIRGSEVYDPHQLNLVQKKSYRITLRSVFATSFLTGAILLAVLYGAAEVITAVTAFSGYETLSFQVFSEAVGRLHALREVPFSRLLITYTGVSVSMGLGFWTLFPYLPTEDEEVTGPVSFLVSWVFLLSSAAMFVPLPVSQPVSLALDAALIAFWGHFFAVAYEDVERYVP